MTQTSTPQPGVSGMAAYVPAYRVNLEDWCQWYQQPWEKIDQIIGHSFRLTPADEDVYTMAASAVLRLILQYQIDPRQVGMLALGTESSLDNAIGAVIVRGLLDQALPQLGLPPLARDCEVPEYKHACLAGYYALKGALRYIANDGRQRQALVVAADSAEYARGSSGEPTQGAGAIAFLVDDQAALFRLNLEQSGCASAYRGPDFRKPARRHHLPDYQVSARRAHDFPVFSGQYSTFAYVDETLQAVRAMWRRSDMQPWQSLQQVRGIFFHRPYHYMPVQGLSFIYIDALYQSGELEQLSQLAAEHQISLTAVADELSQTPDLFNGIQHQPPCFPYPELSRLAAKLRRTKSFRQFQQDKLAPGVRQCMNLGNLYAASLPSWLAAGLETMATMPGLNDDDVFWAIGYGSGDAAEAVPLRLSAGWRQPALKIGFNQALTMAHDLSREQYEALHDDARMPEHRPPTAFTIERIGDTASGELQDIGVPYYRFDPDAVASEQPDQSTQVVLSGG
ncbi:MAG: hypothetical protein Tsb002_02280 [Wenzhouxiangellaceae bacterium]